MKLPCPSCGVNQGGVSRLLWNADSPIGWTCASCQGRFRLASPWLTGIIAVLFGLLLLGVLILWPKMPLPHGGGWDIAVLVIATGAAVWAAHELVLLGSKRRLVRAEDAPAGPWAYAGAFILGMAATCAALYAWLMSTVPV